MGKLCWGFSFFLSGNFLPFCCLRDDEWTVLKRQKTAKCLGILLILWRCLAFAIAVIFVPIYMYSSKKLLFLYPHLCPQSYDNLEGGDLFHSRKIPTFLGSHLSPSPAEFLVPNLGFEGIKRKW